MVETELSYRPDGAAKVLQMSTRQLEKLLASGEIKSLKVGRARYITRAALEQFLREREAASTDE